MNREDSANLVNGYMKQIDRTAAAVAFKPGENVGFSSMTYQNLKIEVGLIEMDDSGMDLLISIGLIPVPGQDREAFMQQLLQWNNFVSGYGHFSLGNDGNTVFMVCRRPVAELDFEEFEALIANMSGNSFAVLRQAQ